MVALFLQHGGGARVGQHPVVETGGGGGGLVVILADLQPEADRLHGALRDEGLVEAPRAVRRVGAGLLVDERAGPRDDPVVELGVEPRHRERRRAAGAAAHGHAAVGILGDAHVVVLLHFRDDLGLDELGVFAGDGVVFEAALAAGAVAAAIEDHDGDGGRHALGVDHVVEDRRERLAAPAEAGSAIRVGGDDEGRGRAGHVLGRDVDGDVACGRGVAGGAGVKLTLGEREREGRHAADRDRRVVAGKGANLVRIHLAGGEFQPFRGRGTARRGRGRHDGGHGHPGLERVERFRCRRIVGADAVVAVACAGLPRGKLGELGDLGPLRVGHGSGAAAPATAPAARAGGEGGKLRLLGVVEEGGDLGVGVGARRVGPALGGAEVV